MIIKESDDKQSDIDTLKSLLNHPAADSVIKSRIEKEIKNIQAGIRGESEAAYEMKVNWGNGKSFAIIHDLRIEHNGLFVQIDHLLINRLFEFHVCESKNFSEGVAINEHGEFTAFFGGRPYGIPSPIEQNDKHILLLSRILKSGVVDIPTRLGIKLSPVFKSFVLISKSARIIRPKLKLAGLDSVIKNDSFATTLSSKEHESAVTRIFNVIGIDTLENFARDIAALHKPISFNWHAKFGLTPLSKRIESTPIVNANRTQGATAAGVPLNQAIPFNQNIEQNMKKLICNTCGTPVPFAVGKFCWFNKQKFGGYVYCRDHQS